MELTASEKKKIEAEERYRYQARQAFSSSADLHGKKDKLAAALLAIFFGDFGIHKFYLGKPVQGIIYLLFCWSGIPAFIGFIEGVIYLCMSDESFHATYK